MAEASKLPPPEPGARVLDTGLVRFWRGSDGVIYDETYMEGRVEGEHMRKGLDAIAELGGGRPHPLLACADRMGSASKEARDLLAGPEAAKLISAMAVIVTSPVARLVLNFFMRVSAPPYPLRLFATLPEAQAWARTYAPVDRVDG
jgi:hypothetical protein